MIPTRLHRTLRIPDLLQDSPIILQVLRKHILLLSQLRQQNTQFIRDVRDRIVAGSLAPVGELGSNGDAFAAGGLVGANGVVFALDHLEQLLAHLGLLHAPQRGHCETVLGRTLLGACCGGAILLGPDGE